MWNRGCSCSVSCAGRSSRQILRGTYSISISGRKTELIHCYTEIHHPFFVCLCFPIISDVYDSRKEGTSQLPSISTFGDVVRCRPTETPCRRPRRRGCAQSTRPEEDSRALAALAQRDKGEKSAYCTGAAMTLDVFLRTLGNDQLQQYIIC